jgi:hypothetical protein
MIRTVEQYLESLNDFVKMPAIDESYKSIAKTAG